MYIIKNPIPILQQKSIFTTTNNKNTDYTQQITDISQTTILDVNKIAKDNNNINQKISSDITDFFNDFFKKPSDKSWYKYIIEIFTKNNRYLLFLFLIVIYILYKLVIHL